RSSGGGVHRRRAALRLADRAGRPDRPTHRRTRPAVPGPRLAAAMGRGAMRGAVRALRGRAAAASPASRVLDQEPGLFDRQGAAPPGLRAPGRPGRGRGPDGRCLSSGGLAVSDSAARGLLVAVLVVLVASALAADLPKLSGGEFWGDGATYYSMAWSLAEDGDLRYEAADLARVRREFSAGPQGLFLK